MKTKDEFTSKFYAKSIINYRSNLLLKIVLILLTITSAIGTFFWENIQNTIPSGEIILTIMFILFLIINYINHEITKKNVIKKIIKKNKNKLEIELRDNNELLETKLMLLESLKDSMKNNQNYTEENHLKLDKIIYKEKDVIEEIKNNISIIQFKLEMIGEDPINIDL